MHSNSNSRELMQDELAWAAQQIATIVGATAEDTQPLASFLSTIPTAAELQSQVLDMLGESPLALEFASTLLYKRFPPPTAAAIAETAATIMEPTRTNPPPLPQRQQQKQPQQTQQRPQQDQQQQTKSQRQIKKEQQAQKLKEQQKKQQATRKRVKCECQATDHELLTNCLECGRIVCASEGPGPCMFCGNDVQGPDQQLQQHMRRLLYRASNTEQPDATTQTPSKAPAAAPVVPKSANSYSMKAGGGSAKATGSAALLWDEPAEPAVAALVDPAPAQKSADEVSEAEYLQLAFQALGIDPESGDPAQLGQAEAWAVATRRKERLLDYDRTAAQRTRLIDEAADFDPHAAATWLSPEEKAQAAEMHRRRAEALEERQANERRGMRVLRLNLASGAVDIQRPEETPLPAAYQPEVIRPKPRKTGDGMFAHNPLLAGAIEPKFVLVEETAAAEKPAKKQGKKQGKKAEPKPKPEPEPEQQAANQLKRMAARRQMLRIQTDLIDEIH
ncbi:hypothetical protein LPJ66_005099 [Kickxella alabastrina]|uniref:Uncharacterized protein n=1 Tax=Kickxella alabastrina TaxID=61397 RepID=A0ACC1IF81_9FUNG|nr:hypothetical protein LPJ66_005099 [Kickxella alabastrina]